MRRPPIQGGASSERKNSLHRLHELARLDAQRPGNIGAGLKILEALLKVAGFKPKGGSKA